MANNTPRSMLNVSFSAEYSGDEFTPRSPWSYIRSHHPSGFSREHSQDRKSRSTERNQFRSPRSKTNSPKRQNSRNLRNTRSRNGTKRAISSSPPRLPGVVLILRTTDIFGQCGEYLLQEKLSRIL